MKNSLLLFSLLFFLKGSAQWTVLPNAISPYSGPNSCMISLAIPNIIQPVANGKIIYTTDCQKSASGGGDVFIQYSGNDMLSMQVKYSFGGLGCCPLYNLNSRNDSTFSYIQSQTGISTVKFTKNNFATIADLNVYTMPAGKATCVTQNYVYSVFQNSSSDTMRIFRSSQSGVFFPKKTNFLYNVVPDKLQFINDSVGFTLANFKSNTSKTALLKTVNYGTTWFPLLVDSLNPITDYHVVSSSLIYLNKQNGTVTGSPNAGLSWVSLSSAPVGNYFAIRFLNDSVGFIGGATGALYKTANYGVGWSAETSNTTQQIDRIFTFGSVAYFTDITKKVFKNQNILTTLESLPTENASGFNIYPNPTIGKIVIKGISKNAKIEVYNTLGEIVFVSQLQTAAANKELDLSSQPSGIYFIKIGSTIKKIVKE